MRLSVPHAPFLFGIALLAASPSRAQEAGASKGTLWEHNGSIMRYLAEGSRRLFVYERPREGLAALGVTKGTVLFDGRRDGARISGSARVYRKDCRRADYAVSGVLDSETRIVLTGRAPVFSGADCAVTGYSMNSANSVLEFTYLSRLD